MSLSQDPITKVLGVRHKPGKDGHLKQTKDTLVYIPILETIQHLLHNESVRSEVYCTQGRI